ncbi:hypothetical protein ACTIQ8_004627 [Vibrio parahaemolyticus]
MDLAKLAVVISILSFLVSVVVFWFSHLKPFKLECTFSAPRLSIYKINDGILPTKNRKSWWIPSIDIGLTAKNLGVKSGQLKDIRIVAIIASKNDVEKIYIYPRYIVNYPIFNRDRTDRFTWLESAIDREWYPIHLSGNQEKHMHIVLEYIRFDEVKVGTLNLELQIATSESNRWRVLDSFELVLTQDMFNSKSSVAPQNKAMEKMREIA